jgi:hypothetical protein
MNIPKGYKLVPEVMMLDKGVIELIAGHCGDGDQMFGDYCDGRLWIGEIEGDEGEKTHGLHIMTDDYPEEGSSTLIEFPAVDVEDAALLELAALREELAHKTEAYQGAHMMCTDLKASLTAAEQRNAEARRLLDIASVRLATWIAYKESPRAEIIEFLTSTAKPTESGASE